jgi:hypothetical protein
MIFSKFAALAIGGFLALTASQVPSSASTLTFDWTLTGPSPSLGGIPETGSGTLTVTTDTGSDIVTLFTGTIGGNTVTLAPTGTLNGNDNLVFPVGTTFVGPPVVTGTTSYVSVSDLDSHGIAFTTSAGTFDIFGFDAPNTTPAPSPTNNNYAEEGAAGFGVGTFALTPTPVPAALPLFAGGLCLVGLLSRRRKRNVISSVLTA